MSHGAAAGFADVITVTNVCKVFPALKPLFRAVTSHPVWGLLECTMACDFSEFDQVHAEVRDVLDMEDGESDDEYDARAFELSRSFCEAYLELRQSFRRQTGAAIATAYIDEDSLDVYAEVSGRYWYIYDQFQLIPPVKAAVDAGLKINRKFYAVYG